MNRKKPDPDFQKEVLEEMELDQDNIGEVEQDEVKIEVEQEGQESGGGQGQNISEEQEEEDLKNKYLRLAADFQNYRRRTEKEKSDIYAYANEKIIVELLGVIDNFERAMSLEQTETGMKEGMSMVFKQLYTALEKNGLSEIEALGSDFDPNFHHAVIMEPSEPEDSGKVIEVLQKGYQLNQKVIRPAMVKVAE